MATVAGRNPDGAGSPTIARLQTFESEQEPSRSRSERGSRDGDEKDDLGEMHRESVYEEGGTASHDELRASEVLRVGSEIDSFVNRNRQASVAHLKLRPQASHALLPDHQPELYDVVTAVTARKNSILGIHTEVKQVALGDEWVEPFIAGQESKGDVSASPQVNVARLSMSVAHAKAKLDGTSSKAIAKHNHQEELDGLGTAIVVEPGKEVPKAISPRANKQPETDPKAAAAAGGGLPKQSSLHMDEAESMAMNKQRQAANTMPQRKELMTGKSENKADDDDSENRTVRIILPARYAPTELSVPPAPSKQPMKAILKPCPIQYNGLAALQRQEAYIASIMDRMKVAAKFMKYNLQGKPNSRYFYITEDGTELHWTKTNPAKGRNKQSLTAEKPRKRYFADVRGVYYGPYNNRRVFRRFLDNKDHFEGSGKDWLCITVAFDDRTLDFCCTTDEQVSTWFLCMQALAPLAASYLTCGSVLWRRLIMKLNAYGLDPKRWPGPLQDPPAAKGRKK